MGWEASKSCTVSVLKSTTAFCRIATVWPRMITIIISWRASHSQSIWHDKERYREKETVYLGNLNHQFLALALLEDTQSGLIMTSHGRIPSVTKGLWLVMTTAFRSLTE